MSTKGYGSNFILLYVKPLLLTIIASVCIIDEPPATNTDYQYNKDQQRNLYIRHITPLLWLPAHVTDRRQQKYQVLWTL